MPLLYVVPSVMIIRFPVAGELIILLPFPNIRSSSLPLDSAFSGDIPNVFAISTPAFRDCFRCPPLNACKRFPPSSETFSAVPTPIPMGEAL